MTTSTRTDDNLNEGAAPVPGGMARLAARIHCVSTPFKMIFTDKRGSVSRPKLLFAVASADALGVALAGILTACIAKTVGDMTAASLLCLCAVAFATVSLLHRQWSYSVSALRRLPAQVIKVLTSTLTVFLALAGIAHIFELTTLPPDTVVVWMLLASVVLCASRTGVATIVDRLSRAGRLVRRTVIVGGGKDAEDLIQTLTRDPSGHLQILGLFDDRAGDRAPVELGSIVKLGSFEGLDAFCRDEGVDLLIVTVPARAEDRLLAVLQKLFFLQVDIRVSALNSRLRLNSSAYSYIGKVPMLAVMDKSLTDWDRVLKNIEDRVLGTLLLLVAAPVMALVALAVRLDSRGPVLFKQKRYGFNNELVEVYKFRSMFAEQSDATASKLVTKSDARVTRVGRFIRRTSLDELPQLFNVLLGDMSLVGPRPHATQAKAERDLYQDVVQEYFARHRVKPGVTGWAQISGWRGETDTHDKIQRRVEHDLYYIDNWSILFDLYIIAMTPFSLLSGKNAY